MARRGRGLSDEDRALWALATRQARPLEAGRKSLDPEAGQADPPAAPQLPAETPRPVPQMPAPPAGFRIGARAGNAPLVSASLSRGPAEDLAAAPVRMDARAHRKLTKGKLHPEARIDLHGMTLAQAHHALIGFILRAQADGRRLVLVITGKGSRQRDDDPAPTRPGVLRHQVPYWLHDGVLGQIVQQVLPAHLRHGGTGAYYVYLRRR